jgi:hypothetical protein
MISGAGFIVAEVSPAAGVMVGGSGNWDFKLFSSVYLNFIQYPLDFLK